MTALSPALEAALREALHTTAPLQLRASAGGGCIHTTCAIHAAGADTPAAFLKLNSAECLVMFEAEAAALKALAAAESGLRVPRPIGCGVADHHAWLLLEHLPLNRGQGGAQHFESMAAGLARLHQILSPNGRYGWHHDNFIGSTPQRNPWTQNWAEFFRDQRLAPQLELASAAGCQFKPAARLLDRVQDILRDHQPPPSLLHGDLWPGNAGFLPNGSPAVFDPAAYFGDRETDLAFSRLFGGFPAAFYTAYARQWPLPPGHERRASLYNLYHLLNHFLLFGEPYGRQAEASIEALLR